MTRRKRLRFQNRVLLITLLTVAPFAVATTVMLFLSDVASGLRWTILGFLAFGVLIGLVAIRRHVVRPLQTLANMLEALREGDYSMRGRNVDPEDSFGEVMVAVIGIGTIVVFILAVLFARSPDEGGEEPAAEPEAAITFVVG